MNLVIGIDASRNRSGGAIAHLVGILNEEGPERFGVRKVHVWAPSALLSAVHDKAWLVKHSPQALQHSLVSQIFWQATRMKREAQIVGCDVLFTTDASTFCRFSPMIVLSQDMLSYEPGIMKLFGFGMQRLRLQIILLLQNRAFRFADGVIFLTHYAATLVQKSCGPLKRIAYIPHGIGSNFKREKIYNDWPINDERAIRCLYVSNADRYKHQWVVVRAVALLRDRGYNLTLTLVGGGGGLGQYLLDEQIILSDPKGEFVEQLDFLPQSDIPRYLGSADLFVFASSCENLPITLLEAMAVGLPIACSNRGPMPEVLKDGGIFFDPEDDISIAAAIEEIIRNSAARQFITKRAKSLADQYSWTRCADETWNFIVNTYRKKIDSMLESAYKICCSCIMDTSDPNIVFDNRGCCDYCNNYKSTILPNWQTDAIGHNKLMHLANNIKATSRGGDFDCIIGLSGGLDSSYVAYVAKEMMGLRPLLFHVDAGWNTDQAVGNIEKLVDGLGLDLYTEVIDWEEMKDLQAAFLRSGIPDQDLPQDAAFFSSLYKFAQQHNIKHVITGSNFSTECCREPEEWGGYLGIDKLLFGDIHRQFGQRPLKTFPLTDIFVYKLYHQMILGMKIHYPLNLIPFVKRDAEDELEQLFGWKRFQHKHHESRFTRFYEDFWLPRRFGFDKRRAHFSSLIQTGQMSREVALERIAKPEMGEHFLRQEFEYVAHKLDLTVNELQYLFDSPKRTFHNYRNKRWMIGLGANIMRLLGIEKRFFR